MKRITLELLPDDAEPFLRRAAYDAAMFGALCDYMTKRTGSIPYRGHGESLEDARKRWQVKFLAGKRIVEAFGIEYEPTSEEETLTVGYPMEGGNAKRHNIAGLALNVIHDSKPNYDKPYPAYRRGVHEEACKQAVERVVRKWRAGL